MAIRVGVTGGSTRVVGITASGQRTHVKRVVVGTPVRRVSAAANRNEISELIDVDVTGKQTGSLLIYNESSGKWEASIDLEQQNINGGSY